MNRKRLRRLLRYYLPALVLVGILVVVGLVSYIKSDAFRRFGERFGGDLLGTDVRIGAWSLNLFDGISIEDVGVGSADEPGLRFAVKRIDTDFGIVDALFGNMNSVVADAPSVTIGFDKDMAPQIPKWAVDLFNEILAMESSTEGPLPEVTVRDGRIELEFPDDKTCMEIRSVVLTPKREKKYYGVDALIGISGRDAEITIRGDLSVYDLGGLSKIEVAYRNIDPGVIASVASKWTGKSITMEGGRLNLGVGLEVGGKVFSGSVKIDEPPLRCVVDGREMNVPAIGWTATVKKVESGDVDASAGVDIDGIGNLSIEGSANLAKNDPWVVVAEIRNLDLEKAGGIISATDVIKSATLNGRARSLVDAKGPKEVEADIGVTGLRALLGDVPIGIDSVGLKIKEQDPLLQSGRTNTDLHLGINGISVKPFPDSEVLKIDGVGLDARLFVSPADTLIDSATMTLAGCGNTAWHGSIKHASPEEVVLNLDGTVDMRLGRDLLDTVLGLRETDFEVGVESVAVFTGEGRKISIRGRLDSPAVEFPLNIEIKEPVVRQSKPFGEVSFESVSFAVDPTAGFYDRLTGSLGLQFQGLKATNGTLSANVGIGKVGLVGSYNAPEGTVQAALLDSFDCRFDDIKVESQEYRFETPGLWLGTGEETKPELTMFGLEGFKASMPALMISTGSFKLFGRDFEVAGSNGFFRTGLEYVLDSGGADIKIGESMIHSERFEAHTSAGSVVLATPEFRFSGLSVGRAGLIETAASEGLLQSSFDWRVEVENVGRFDGSFLLGGKASSYGIEDLSTGIEVSKISMKSEVSDELLPVKLDLAGGTVDLTELRVGMPDVGLSIGKIVAAHISAVADMNRSVAVNVKGSMDTVNLDEDWPKIASVLGETAKQWTLGGKFNCSFAGSATTSGGELDLTLDRLDAAIEGASGLAADGSLGWFGSQGSVSMSGKVGKEGRELTLSAKVKPGELILKESFPNFGGEEVRLSTKVIAPAGDDNKISCEGTVGLPGEVEIRYAGKVGLESSTPEVGLHVAGESIKLASVVAVLMPVFAPDWKNNDGDGRLSFACDVGVSWANLLAQGRIDTQSAALALGEAKSFFVSGVDLACPFRVGMPSPAEPADVGKTASLIVDGIGLGSDIAGPLKSRFVLWNNRFGISEPLSMDLFGGRIELDKLSIDDLLSPAPNVELSGKVVDLDLEKMCIAYGISPLRGKMSVQIPRVYTEGDMLKMDGTAEISIFGGIVRVSDLRIEAYRSFSPILGFSMEFEGIDLAEVIRIIPLGRLEGIVKGYAKNFRLCLDPFEPYSFEIQVESDDSRKSDRMIGFDAVALFASMGDSDFASYAGLLQKADLYGYKKLGLWVKLANDMVHAKGLIKKGEEDYFIVGSGMKKINLIVTTPPAGYPYGDIKGIILERIQTAFEEGGPTVGIE